VEGAHSLATPAPRLLVYLAAAADPMRLEGVAIPSSLLFPPNGPLEVPPSSACARAAPSRRVVPLV